MYFHSNKCIATETGKTSTSIQFPETSISFSIYSQSPFHCGVNCTWTVDLTGLRPKLMAFSDCWSIVSHAARTWTNKNMFCLFPERKTKVILFCFRKFENISWEIFTQKKPPFLKETWGRWFHQWDLRNNYQYL